jgi:solute carrier family 6 amino acid transporter-like protein 5/7/9/14
LQLFAVLFFIMLYVLGVGSAVALMAAVINIIRDDFPKFKYLWVTVVTCVLGFVGGLVYVTPVSV